MPGHAEERAQSTWLALSDLVSVICTSEGSFAGNVGVGEICSGGQPFGDECPATLDAAPQIPQ